MLVVILLLPLSSDEHKSTRKWPASKARAGDTATGPPDPLPGCPIALSLMEQLETPGAKRQSGCLP